MTYRVPDSRAHSHASCSGCHLGHETWLPGCRSRGANSRRRSHGWGLSRGRWSRRSSHLRCPAGRRGHAGGAAPASTRHDYLQRSSASRASRSGRDPSGFCRPRERKTGGGVGLGSWPINAQAEAARSPTSPRALKVTGRAGRHGGAGPYAVCVMSSAPGSFRRPEVLELSPTSFVLPV